MAMTDEDQRIWLRVMHCATGMWRLKPTFESEAERSAWRDSEIMRVIEAGKLEELLRRRRIQTTGRT